MTFRHAFSITLVVSMSVAPAFAQKGGGGGGGGGGDRGSGSGTAVNGGGNSAGAPSGGGGGGGGGSSFGGGGSSTSASSGGVDWSVFSTERANGAASRAARAAAREARAAEPAYARAVPPGARSIDAASGTRPRGDRPALGQAVERQTPIDRTNRGRSSLVTRYDPYFDSFGFSAYSSLYYSCYGYRRVYCYQDSMFDPWYSGYGYYGLNSLYYDPYWFYGGPTAGPAAVNPAAGLGSLRLKIKPNKGQVFIDGNYVGTVDDFDGALQKLRLEQGSHRVEVRLLGYEPLVFDVEIRRGQQTVFEGQLRPRQ